MILFKVMMYEIKAAYRRTICRLFGHKSKGMFNHYGRPIMVCYYCHQTGNKAK